MNCELCDRKNVEHVGMMCGAHRVCFICVNKLVANAVADKMIKDIAQGE